MELHLDVDSAVAEYIEETGLAGHLSAFLSQVIFADFFLFTKGIQFVALDVLTVPLKRGL
jgi:hypothetical protein